MCPNDVLTKQFLQGVLSVSWEISANKEVNNMYFQKVVWKGLFKINLLKNLRIVLIQHSISSNL